MLPFLFYSVVLMAAKLTYQMVCSGRLYVNDRNLYVNGGYSGASYLKSKCFINSSL